MGVAREVPAREGVTVFGPVVNPADLRHLAVPIGECRPKDAGVHRRGAQKHAACSDCQNATRASVVRPLLTVPYFGIVPQALGRCAGFL